MPENQTDTLGTVARQLLAVADGIRDAKFLRQEAADTADSLTWSLYEAGAFPDDKLFVYLVNKQLAEDDKPLCEGFAELLIKRWLPVRCAGFTPPSDDKKLFENGVRQLARIIAGGQTGELLTEALTIGELAGFFELSRNKMSDMLPQIGAISFAGKYRVPVRNMPPKYHVETGLS
jgi:hypothetical protein